MVHFLVSTRMETIPWVEFLDDWCQQLNPLLLLNEMSMVISYMLLLQNFVVHIKYMRRMILPFQINSNMGLP
jgi:hypothetical protein